MKLACSEVKLNKLNPILGITQQKSVCSEVWVISFIYFITAAYEKELERQFEELRKEEAEREKKEMEERIREEIRREEKERKEKEKRCNCF